MRDTNKKVILMVGPDLDVKGGVSSVEKVILSNELFRGKYKIIFQPTHKDYSKIGKLIYAVYSIIIFFFKLIKNNVDLVYIHMSHGMSFFRKSLIILICIIMRKKFILHMHASLFDEFYKERKPLGKRYISFILNHSSRMITLSQNWKKFYSDIATKADIRIIYNSVDVPDKNQYNLNNNIILFLGKLGKRKGIYDLIEIVPEILSNNSEVRFILAGDGDVEEVRKAVIDNGYSSRIDVPGWISSTTREELLKMACLYVLPSYAEGLPMSVLEAMSYGIPVITTFVGGLPELIEDGYNGIMITPGDKNTLTERIMYFLTNKDIRQKISDNCYKVINENFNSKLYIEKLIGLIEEVIK